MNHSSVVGVDQEALEKQWNLLSWPQVRIWSSAYIDHIFGH